MTPSRVIVAGGAGFIGSQIAQAFLERGWQVGVVDGLVENTGGSIENVAGFRDSLQFLTLQRLERDPDFVKRLQWADLVVDAMAFTGHLLGFQDPLMDAGFNLLSHLHLLKALKACPGKRVIYLGSRSQYGAVSSEAVTEESFCHPLDPQGINKLAAEQFFRIYGRPYKFETISLRLTNCFGPRQRVSGELGLVGSFIECALRDQPIEIFGSPERTKNVLFVDDVARLVVEMAERDWKGFEVFNIGGAEVAIEELLAAIFRAAGRGSFTVKPFPEKIKKIDVGEAMFSDQKLTEFMGYRRRTDLADAIKRTVEYFKENQELKRS